MTALRGHVVADTLEEVEVVYLDRVTSKWWNKRKDKDDTAVFCGYYWVKGSREAGPFKTRSSAIRDAYYRFVLNRPLPGVGHTALSGVAHEPAKPKRGRPSKADLAARSAWP